MSRLLEKYPQPDMSVEAIGYVPGIQERLKREKQRLEDRLEQVTAALDALEKQPQVAELLETIIKVV